MHDSADIKSAKIALSAAIDSLESTIGPILSRMKTLEAAAGDSDAFREDRSKLAAELDEMAAKTEEAAAKAEHEAQRAQAATERLMAREQEFTQLTQESEAQLDRVMAVVRNALEA